jgi:hypothetical protein
LSALQSPLSLFAQLPAFADYWYHPAVDARCLRDFIKALLGALFLR